MPAPALSAPTAAPGTGYLLLVALASPQQRQQPQQPRLRKRLRPRPLPLLSPALTRQQLVALAAQRLFRKCWDMIPCFCLIRCLPCISLLSCARANAPPTCAAQPKHSCIPPYLPRHACQPRLDPAVRLGPAARFLLRNLVAAAVFFLPSSTLPSRLRTKMTWRSWWRCSPVPGLFPRRRGGPSQPRCAPRASAAQRLFLKSLNATPCFCLIRCLPCISLLGCARANEHAPCSCPCLNLKWTALPLTSLVLNLRNADFSCFC